MWTFTLTGRVPALFLWISLKTLGLEQIHHVTMTMATRMLTPPLPRQPMGSNLIRPVQAMPVACGAWFVCKIWTVPPTPPQPPPPLSPHRKFVNCYLEILAHTFACWDPKAEIKLHFRENYNRILPLGGTLTKNGIDSHFHLFSLSSPTQRQQNTRI